MKQKSVKYKESKYEKRFQTIKLAELKNNTKLFLLYFTLQIKSSKIGSTIIQLPPAALQTAVTSSDTVITPLSGWGGG